MRLQLSQCEVIYRRVELQCKNVTNGLKRMQRSQGLDAGNARLGIYVTNGRGQGRVAGGPLSGVSEDVIGVIIATR